MNPFRELLNGAQDSNSRDIPIEFNPIAPMSIVAQRDAEGNDVAVKMLDEWEAKKRAYLDYLRSRQNQPQMQMPNVQPNKTAAIIGGLLGLLGAVTGDKRAVPAFGQFAGGLQQNTEAQRQRLLQEQQLKMQNQAQKDKAIGQLLGFEMEDAQDAYARANAADVANRKAKSDSQAEADKREFEKWKILTQAGSRETVAKTAAEASVERAKIQAVPKAEALYTSMLKSGVPEPQARDIAYQMTLYAAKTDNLKSGAEYDRLRPTLQREGMTLKEKLANQSEQGRNSRAEAGRAASFAKTQYTQDRISERKGAQSPGKGGSQVGKSSYSALLGRDPDYSNAERSYRAMREPEAAALKAYNAMKDELAVGHSIDPKQKPDAAWMTKFNIARDRYLQIKEKRARFAKIMAQRESAIRKGDAPMNPMGGTTGGSAPASVRQIK